MKKFFKILLTIGLIIVVIVAAYVGYVLLSYERIADSQQLEPTKINTALLKTDTPYTAVSYNIGYGSYPPDYTFFMDGGKESIARSKEDVYACLDGSVRAVRSLNPDFVMLQEVDVDGTKSLHINEYDYINSSFSDYDRVFAVNYDSAYLFYPLTRPIGKTLGGLATYARYPITDAIRRSLPIATSLSKLLDLDRCYSISSLPVENGKMLYLYNIHMSAYGNEGGISARQVEMLVTDMQEKIDAGGYVICGGDYNHDFTGDSIERLNTGTQERLSWAQPFPEELLTDDIIMCRAYPDNELIPSARNLDVPYEPGVSLTLILDGFLISSNVTCETVQNIDNGFLYSDHNPVFLRFTLN
ncbi:MAG: endonuclease/exonuclease/phosphatase family protein [Clostridia bacterium]